MQRETTNQFEAGMKKQATWKERHDCAVRAIATATNTPYEKVHDTLAMLGRKNRYGTSRAQQRACIAKLGFDWVEVDYRKKGLLTYISLCRKAPKGRYLVHTNKHVAAFTRGLLHDYEWVLGTRRKIKGLTQIVKRRSK